MMSRSGAAQDENTTRVAGKPSEALAAARPVTRNRAALGDVTNVAPQRAPAAKPSTRAATYAPAPVAAAPAQPTLAERGITDIDEIDAHDPHCVTDYVGEIYAHFRATELAKNARFGYMSHQTDINEKMRAILIDWLFEVHAKFKLQPETLYLTVNIIDRYLERRMVARQKLQLVGVTAMLLAAKYEEIYAPEIRDFVYITDKAYTREQILGMEGLILGALEFRVTVPTAYVFLARGMKAADAELKTQLLAQYITERCLQEYRMLAHPPSKLAAACLNMALRSMGTGTWNATLSHFTGYTEAELRPTIREAEAVLENGMSSSLQAVRKKYQAPKYMEVSLTPIVHME